MHAVMHHATKNSRLLHRYLHAISGRCVSSSIEYMTGMQDIMALVIRYSPPGLLPARPPNTAEINPFFGLALIPLHWDNL
jgi:hypothetical protein